MDAYPREAWLRLGQHLQKRRPQIDTRYRVRKVFAEENGLTDKTVQEIENAYRTTFSPVMLSTVEAAYRLKEGSIERFLAGGELEPRVPVAQVNGASVGIPDARPGVRVERYDDRHLRVDVTVDTESTMEEALAHLGTLTPHEAGTVEWMQNMRYEPAEIAGMVMFLRGLAEQQQQQRPWRRKA